MSPYGESKLAAENEIFSYKSPGTVFRALRFFNVIGADPEGRLGEMQSPSTLPMLESGPSVFCTLIPKLQKSPFSEAISIQLMEHQ